MPDVASPAAERKLSDHQRLTAVITVHREPVDLGIPGFVPAPLVVVRVGPPQGWRRPRPPRRIDSRQLVPVVPRRVIGAYRAPRRRRIARSGSRVGGSGLDPPGPGNGTTAAMRRAAGAG